MPPQRLSPIMSPSFRESLQKLKSIIFHLAQEYPQKSVETSSNLALLTPISLSFFNRPRERLLLDRSCQSLATLPSPHPSGPPADRADESGAVASEGSPWNSWSCHCQGLCEGARRGILQSEVKPVPEWKDSSLLVASLGGM